MSWGAAVADEARRLGNPTYLINHGWLEYQRARTNGPRPLQSMGRAQMDAFIAGAHWLADTQNQWDTLTVPDVIWELRRGEASVFWPIIHTIDPGENPQINVECPSDRTHPAGSLQPVNRDGYCLVCGYEHV